MTSNDRVILLDGAMGTELDRRGADVSLPLWSARAIFDEPEMLEALHAAYLEAGADVITTNTFRTNRYMLARCGMGARAEELTRRAVDLALSARDRVRPDAQVVGSVAPLEDCYRPDLAPPTEVCAQEHGGMIRCLLDAGVDLILIETMNNLSEAAAAARCAAELAPGRWLLCFCPKSDGPPGLLLSGEPYSDLLPEVESAVAVGVNCVTAPVILDQVTLLRKLTPENVRVAAYANVGHAEPDGSWVSTDAVDPERYARYARQWADAGATVIGGCCGTTPETIAALAGALRQ